MSGRGNIPLLKTVLIGVPLALVLLAASSAWWLLKTPSGAAWLWGQVEDATAGAVRSTRVDGDLFSGFSVQGFRYQSGAVVLSVGQLEFKARPGLWPPAIQLPSLVLRDVEIVSRSSGEAGEDAPADVQIQSALETLDLPVAVHVHAAEISNMTLQIDDDPPLALAESLHFSARLDDGLMIERLALRAPAIEATLDGRLTLKPPFDVSIAVQGRIETQGSASVPRLVFPFRLESTGALEKLPFTLVSVDPGLELGTERLGLAVAGWLSGQAVQFDRMTLTGPGLELAATGRVGFSKHRQAAVTLAIGQLDLSPWLTAWPAGQQLLGDLELSWSDSGLEISRGTLGVAGTDLAVNLAADIDVGANAVNALVDWRNLHWPLADTSPDFSSPAGRLSVTGSLDQWAAVGQLDVGMGDHPQGRLEISGAGTRTSARINILDGEVLGGRISGEAGADWQNGLAWDLHIHTSGIDPEPLLPGWPGRIDAEIEASAGSQSEVTRIRLASLSGSMRGIPLTGHGGLSLAGDAVTLESVTFEDVELSTDAAVMHLDGTAASPAGVRLEFNGRLPATLLQGATGTVEAEARYSSAAGHSLLDVQLQAHGLGWNGFRAEKLAVTTHTDAQPGPVPGMQVDASGLAWRDTALDTFSLAIEPAGGQYRLNANLAAEHVAMHTAMTLVPANAHDPFNHPWRGLLDELVVTAGETYQFELQQGVALQWAGGGLSIDPACVRENSGAQLCMNIDYNLNGDWSMVADVAAVPLDYLQDIFDLNVHFEQYLEGRLEWRQSGGRTPAGGADFRITAGRILDLDDDDVLTRTSEGRFGFRLANGNLESGSLDVEFPGAGFVDVDFRVTDIIENGGGNLHGSVITRLDSLELVGQLALPMVDVIDGQFESNIQLGGSLSNPVFDGSFSLSNGLVHYAPVGLKLEAVAIEGQLEKSDRASLKGSFRAGDGKGSVDGHILFEDIDNLQADVSLSGDRLLLVNTDDLKINTETELSIGLSPYRIDVNGYIRIPDARLTPTNLLLERVTDSEDLLIEGQAGGIANGVEDKPRVHRVYGQLEVAFGEQVSIAVPDIETHISGSVVYHWQGGRVPLADGSYRLNGTVDVYGPTLEITNGSVSFPGVPADNPLLNIRAEREIFGNTQIRSAGVQLIGTLKRPVLEAYTMPLTNEDRAWTLLVTGTDFDQSQGVGGFDVGTYIAPKLYVSYGISLFEDENVISARYDLKKGFGIKVTSGQRETGADVSYTIDR